MGSPLLTEVPGLARLSDNGSYRHKEEVIIFPSQAKPKAPSESPVSHDIKILRATIKPHFPSVVPLQLRDSAAQHQPPEAGWRSSPSEPQSPSSPFTHSQSFSQGSAPPPHFHTQPGVSNSATNLQTPEFMARTRFAALVLFPPFPPSPPPQPSFAGLQLS